MPLMDVSPNPWSALSSFFNCQLTRLAAQLEGGKQFIASVSKQGSMCHQFSQPFGSLTINRKNRHLYYEAKHRAKAVAKKLDSITVFTLCNSANNIILLADPKGENSIVFACFRKADAKSILAQVKLQNPNLAKDARVAPVGLDQVYMKKIEGIAVRFLPDPDQIRNVFELKVANPRTSFDGVPVFQSDFIAVNRDTVYPIYFRKEDIEEDLLTDRGAQKGELLDRNIMVGSLEDVLKKMEVGDLKMKWEEVRFVRPGERVPKEMPPEMII